jgi:hypothetical protein
MVQFSFGKFLKLRFRQQFGACLKYAIALGRIWVEFEVKIGTCISDASTSGAGEWDYAPRERSPVKAQA